jgi:hypothetical protein
MVSHQTGLAGVRRLGIAVALAVGVSTLAGCYVVPMQSYPAPSQSANGPVVLAPSLPVTFSARLYPSNELASSYGVVNAVVTNDLNGRGTFNANINGESFVGEATRRAGSSREGLANGAGNRGSFLNCQYTMNSATLGTGSCRLSNGATFTMHVGQ